MKLLSKFAYILYHFPKINDGWPTFAKLKRAPFELLKKESQKKGNSISNTLQIIVSNLS